MAKVSPFYILLCTIIFNFIFGTHSFVFIFPNHDMHELATWLHEKNLPFSRNTREDSMLLVSKNTRPGYSHIEHAHHKMKYGKK
jgi:hypothetical protein